MNSDMTISTQSSFDYAALEDDTRIFVLTHTGEIKSLMRRSVQDIIEIGKRLIEVKERLDHGKFQDWISVEFEWTYPTAVNFMRVAERMKNINFIFLDRFQPSALYLLAAPSAPEDALKKAMEAAEDGQTITYSAAKEIIREALKDRRNTAWPAPSDDTPDLPHGKYGVLYADPPWKYQQDMPEGYGGTVYHYPSMTIEELCALPVKELAADDAVLFMWVTSPKLNECWPILEAWGFTYKTSFVWDKVKHNYGHYNSVRHEFLLIAGRGKCTPETSQLHDSVITIERSQNHSEKPEYFRELIEGMYPSARKIELFARERHENWFCWGNQL